MSWSDSVILEYRLYIEGLKELVEAKGESLQEINWRTVAYAFAFDYDFESALDLIRTEKEANNVTIQQ